MSGNDQQNVSRIIQHPMDSYADLDFVILKDVKQASDIPLTRIYADSIPVSISIWRSSTELLPQSMHGLGILRPYNATYLTEYPWRSDAAGQIEYYPSPHLYRCRRDDTYEHCNSNQETWGNSLQGCNIPNIERIVVVRIHDVNVNIRPMSRTSRMWSWNGRIAILLVEKSVYEEDLFSPQKPMENAKRGEKKKTRTVPEDSQRTEPIYHSRGVKRSSRSGKKIWCHTLMSLHWMLKQRMKVWRVFVQTGKCRRQIWGKSTATKRLVRLIPSCESDQALTLIDSDPIIPCCDICCPELLNQACPGLAPKVQKEKKAKKDVLTCRHNDYENREQQLKSGAPRRRFLGEGVFWKDKIVVLLSAVGQRPTKMLLPLKPVFTTTLCAIITNCSKAAPRYES